MKGRRKLFFRIILLGFFLLCIGACSSESEKKSQVDDEKKETKQVEDKKAKKDKGIPTDEELIAVLDKNLETMQAGDIEGYMSTIHDESPSFESTKQLIEQFASQYTFDIEISDVEVVEKSVDEAKVTFTQRTMKVKGPEYKNNEVKGYHILKPYKGKWKIYESAQSSVQYLDENGNPVEDTSGVTGPDVPAFNPGTGDNVYFSEIEKLNFTIDERNWKLDYYDEDTNNGMAIAEFVLENETVENWSELYTIHYYEDGKLYSTPESFISNMDAAIREEVTGQIDFQSYDVTAEEGFYEFYIHDDQIEQNQHEVARLFYAGDDMFLVRYTRIGEPMDDATKMKWVTSLKQVTAGQ
ncbi:hypothetical protein [Caldibacillus thermoamylovorans]|uniref:hypothetical protein n=1 Tax=Caldibacillus thermoamylovorans TaxID=35841 RepID=UPI00203FC4AC|nr:hypothetical protein [Caldibacillus thermoamylovorans]MCM3477819.1 hypothetical protein [Caldibacillus thermoamylovorans]